MDKLIWMLIKILWAAVIILFLFLINHQLATILSERTMRITEIHYHRASDAFGTIYLPEKGDSENVKRIKE